MLFWIIAMALTAVVSGFLGLALLRGHAHQESAAGYDLQVYRDQLKDVDKDLARGVIAEADADRIRTEISRRILAADAQLTAEAGATGQPTGRARLTATVCFVVLAVGSFGLYAKFGAPGYPDLPLADRYEQAQDMLANRASQAAFEAQLPAQQVPAADPDFINLMNTLRDKVKERPDDIEGHQLLARNEGSLGNYQAAYAAQQRVIDLKGDAVTGNDYTQLADLMIRAAQGYISPEADTALRQALSRNPNDGFARYYVGLMMIQNGRPDMSFRLWHELLDQSPPSAPWVTPIRSRIEDLAWLAGVDYTLPELQKAAPLAGPSTQDIEAAENMSPEDRAEMISAMVQGLSDRLATEGGTPEEWARLISAHGVLGNTEQALAIANEAKTVFANSPEALNLINMAEAGLATVE